VDVYSDIIHTSFFSAFSHGINISAVPYNEYLYEWYWDTYYAEDWGIDIWMRLRYVLSGPDNPFPSGLSKFQLVLTADSADNSSNPVMVANSEKFVQISSVHRGYTNI
jgi:hypothetical protein